jgi:hypothetical protein
MNSSNQNDPKTLGIKDPTKEQREGDWEGKNSNQIICESKTQISEELFLYCSESTRSDSLWKND